jgi:hypothetical protein
MFLVPEGQAHRVLTIEVGLIVGEKHIVVVGQQRVDQGLEQVSVAAGKLAACQ